MSRDAAKTISKAVLGVFLAAATALFNVALAPRTAPGTHCPTAAVQQIVVDEPSEGDEARTVYRAPQPGDLEFKQCLCAETRAVEKEQKKQAESGFAPFPFVLTAVRILPELPVWNLPTVWDHIRPRTCTCERSPLIPPPRNFSI